MLELFNFESYIFIPSSYITNIFPFNNVIDRGNFKIWFSFLYSLKKENIINILNEKQKLINK